MQYDLNKLPDFYSVRDIDQINYSLEDLEGKKCFAFFDNGFTSNVISCTRPIKFIWDGFLLFVDDDVTLEDIRNNVNLYNSRLVGLQRTSFSKKLNNIEMRKYILNQLLDKGIPTQIMPDTQLVDGYPTKCDLWSTREASVLVDATECTGKGEAYFFKDSYFSFTITFPESNLPDFNYEHNGAVVLNGENSTAISRLICNNQSLREYLENVIGTEKIYSYIQKENISGTNIKKIEEQMKKHK